MYMYMYIYVIYMYMYMYIYVIYMYMYIYIYVIYTYIHIHVHIHSSRAAMENTHVQILHQAPRTQRVQDSAWTGREEEADGRGGRERRHSSCLQAPILHFHSESTVQGLGSRV